MVESVSTSTAKNLRQVKLRTRDVKSSQLTGRTQYLKKRVKKMTLAKAKESWGSAKVKKCNFLRLQKREKKIS